MVHEHLDICVGAAQWFLENHPQLGTVVRARADLGEPIQVRVLMADPDGSFYLQRERSEDEFDKTRPAGSLHDRLRRVLAGFLTLFDGVETAEVRVTDDPELWSHGIFRFDDEMLAYPYIRGLRGIGSAALHLKRVEVDGLFDTYVSHVDNLWHSARLYSPPDVPATEPKARRKSK